MIFHIMFVRGKEIYQERIFPSPHGFSVTVVTSGYWVGVCVCGGGRGRGRVYV